MVGCVFSSSKSASSLGEQTHRKERNHRLVSLEAETSVAAYWKTRTKGVQPGTAPKELFVILPQSGNFRHNRALPLSACTLTQQTELDQTGKKSVTRGPIVLVGIVLLRGIAVGFLESVISHGVSAGTASVLNFANEIAAGNLSQSDMYS
jgi:hypothetical protein